MKTATKCLLAAAIVFTVQWTFVGQAKADSERPLILLEDGYFFVGGEYTDPDNPMVMAGQMYVRYQIPRIQRRSHRLPVVMVHGGGQTGTNFWGTPDGREGWAQFFLRQGYPVYVVDQVGRGKSAYIESEYGPRSTPNSQTVVTRFTAPKLDPQWPQAVFHTQWPGEGVPGDPIFDEFFASQVPGMTDSALQGELNTKALVELLERIGLAIVLTHSQSGPFGWLLADAAPDLVAAILAVEPSGGPFYNVGSTELDRPWGITQTPITYSPEVTDPAQLSIVQEPEPDEPELVSCWLQAEPARTLPNLAGIPILILTGEASYHAQYDHCTAKYLTQAGVANDFVPLEEAGIYGNGHMIMLELNNQKVAALMHDWLRDVLRSYRDR